MTGWDLVTHIVPWLLTVSSLSFTIYTIIHNNQKDEKKETKECAIDTTTVIVKLESIQQTLNKLSDSVASIQSKMENLDHRLTIVETKLALGAVDAKNLNI